MELANLHYSYRKLYLVYLEATLLMSIKVKVNLAELHCLYAVDHILLAKDLPIIQ